MHTRRVTQWMVTAALAVLVTAPPQGQEPLRSQLVGHWRLVATETIREGEAPVATLGPAPLGTIIYTADGHVQAHLTPRERPKARPADAPLAEARALARYTAYFGRFAVDEATRTVTHRRDGTFVPGGRDIVRTIDLDGSRLVLTTPATSVNARTQYTRITWERLPSAPVAAGFTAAARREVAGTWALVDHRTTLAGGEVRQNFGPAPEGLFIFHPDGHTAVQIVNPHRPEVLPESAAEADLRALHRTYLAYFGTYDVDPATKRIVVHTTADLNPMNTGVDQIRYYSFEGDLMYLQPPPAPGAAGGQQVSRITWRRVR
ncbi:MAG: lipocalin-like domain-containing protein [Acidobacteria bacterium]|nr:lipocalin-like domain-containing protein [Acidobacteriota bacterium]